MIIGVLRAGSWNIIRKEILSLWASILDVSEYHGAFIFVIISPRIMECLTARMKALRPFEAPGTLCPTKNRQVSVDMNFRM
jgi:hypothetical protein